MMGFNIILSISSTLLIVFVSNYFLLLGVQASSKSSENVRITGVTRQTKQSYSDLVQRVKRYTNQLDGKAKEAAFPAATASKGSRGLRLYVSHSHEDDKAESKEPEDTEENSDSLSNESESKEIYHNGRKRKPKGKSRKSHPFDTSDHKSKKYRQKLKAMQKTVNSLVRKGLRTGEEKKIIKQIAPALEARFHRQKHLQDLRDSKRTRRPQEQHKQHLDDIYKMLRGMDDSASAESNPSKLTGKYIPKSSQMYQGRMQQVANPMMGLKPLGESPEHLMAPQLHNGEVLADEPSRAKTAAKPSRQMQGRRVNPVATQAYDNDGKSESKTSAGSQQTPQGGGKSSMKGRRVSPIATQTEAKAGRTVGKATEEGRSSRLMKGGRKVTTVTTKTDDSKEKTVADKPSKTHKSKKIIVIEPGESVEVIRKSDGYKYPFEYVDMSYEDEEDCDDDNKKKGKQAGISKGNTAVQNNKVK